jgi:CRP-like cAMP-binding protein
MTYLKSLVARHVPANNSPTTPHDLHTHHAGSPGSDDGYSDVASNGSLTDVAGSPSSSRPNSPPHHHHHHHSANESALLTAFQTDQEQKIAIVARGLSHFKHGFLTKGFKKWQEFIQLKIWNNLTKKAKNICRGTKTLRDLSKINRKAVTEWVDTICSQIFQKLSKEERREVLEGGAYHEVAEGQPLFYQGDRGKHYWIVLTGEIRITVFESNQQAIRKSMLYKRRQSWVKKKPDATTDNDSFGDFEFGTTVWKAGAGMGFGQIALLTKSPIRSGSCIANAPNTALLAIPKKLYNQYLAHLHEAERNLDTRVAFFKSLPLFKHWSHARLMRT